MMNSGIIDKGDFDFKGSNGNGNIFKSLNLGNTTQLERRIRKELEENGILEMDEILNDSEEFSGEDEILRELQVTYITI